MTIKLSISLSVWVCVLKLSSDSDSNVRYGAELLDRLMKARNTLDYSRNDSVCVCLTGEVCLSILDTCYSVCIACV